MTAPPPGGGPPAPRASSPGIAGVSPASSCRPAPPRTSAAGIAQATSGRPVSPAENGEQNVDMRAGRPRSQQARRPGVARRRRARLLLGSRASRPHHPVARRRARLLLGSRASRPHSWHGPPAPPRTSAAGIAQATSGRPVSPAENGEQNVDMRAGRPRSQQARRLPWFARPCPPVTVRVCPCASVFVRVPPAPLRILDSPACLAYNRNISKLSARCVV